MASLAVTAVLCMLRVDYVVKDHACTDTNRTGHRTWRKKRLLGPTLETIRVNKKKTTELQGKGDLVGNQKKICIMSGNKSRAGTCRPSLPVVGAAVVGRLGVVV